MNLNKWLRESFKCDVIPKEAVDELVALAEIAEDKNKISLIDLIRLLVIEGQQVEYIVSKHWELVEVCVIGYIQAMDIKDKEAKVTHRYHLTCLKMLANLFHTSEGKQAMQDSDKVQSLIEFCTRSLFSCDAKVI